VEQKNIPSDALRFLMHQDSSHFSFATVIIPASFVQTIYGKAVYFQQHCTHTHGFPQGRVPLEYIQENFRSHLLEHVKEFLFNYFVISFLYQEIRKNKLLVAGEPRIHSIELDMDHDAKFTFALNLFEHIPLQEWRYFPFKAPKRKKYKDLDRQVEQFIEYERQQLKNTTENNISIDDWVGFSLYPVDTKNNPLFDGYQEDLWLKMGNEEADIPMRSLFVDKNVGDIFCSTDQPLQKYFSDHVDTRYNFCVEITHVVHHSYFCLDQFKKHFRIKTNKELHQKLIEVFSYRNDLSLRRSMIEESFKLLLSKHRFHVPNHLVLRQQKMLLNKISQNPDYHVYRAQRDFKLRVKQLAEKQAREKLMIDMIAYKDNVSVSQEDIKTYLNLTNRPRTKGFIYFDPPETKLDGKEIPLPAEELKQTCLREKTLNHIIHHLTRK